MVARPAVGPGGAAALAGLIPSVPFVIHSVQLGGQTVSLEHLPADGAPVPDGSRLYATDPIASALRPTLVALAGN